MLGGSQGFCFCRFSDDFPIGSSTMTEEPTGYFSIFFMPPPDPQIQEIAGQYHS